MEKRKLKIGEEDERCEIEGSASSRFTINDENKLPHF